MSASRRNCLGKIEKRVAGKGPLNQPVENWETAFDGIWSDIRGATGLGAIKESEGGVPNGGNVYSIEIKFRPTGIDEGMRFNHNGRLFNIAKIRHDFAGKESTWLICTLGANDG